MNKNKTIILTAGGTGGHLFPAIAMAEELNTRGIFVHLITDLRCKKYLSDKIPATIHIIDLHIKTAGIKNKVISIAHGIKAFIKAFILLRKTKPDMIIGFGGYPSFPSMFAAMILKIPMIIQEQNCFLGKTNRFFAKHARIIALSYKETINLDHSLQELSQKLLFTGNIIRLSVKNKSVEEKDFSCDKLHLFVFGGSQGAKIFSTLVPEAISELKKLNPDIKLSITQQVSQEEKNKLEKCYDEMNIPHELSDFFYNIEEIYDKSQLVIARSGASTVAELSNIGLPAIFIPFPYAAEDHQYFNAKAVADNGASWCYREANISAAILAKKLNELIMNRNLLKEASIKLLERKTDGAKKFADTVLEII